MTAPTSTLTDLLAPAAAGAATPAAAVAPEDFTGAFRAYAGGVAVITADAGAGPVGFTATSVTSVSVDPPILAFSVSDQSSSAPTVVAAASVVIHLLGSSQVDIARLCATSGADRFADATIWDRLDGGEPYFPAAQSWIRGDVINRVRAGNATIVVVQATATGAAQDAAPTDTPLVYHGRAWHTLGEHSRVAS